MAVIRHVRTLQGHQRIKAEHRKFRDLSESIPDATFAIDTGQGDCLEPCNGEAAQVLKGMR